MRYLVTIIGIITVIAGTYFNVFFFKYLDIKFLGSSEAPLTSSSQYSRWIDMNITHSNVEYIHLQKMYDDFLSKALQKRVQENGQLSDTVTGIDITTRSDTSHAWGASADPYEFKFQGFRELPEENEKGESNSPIFHTDMVFIPKVSTGYYRAPIHVITVDKPNEVLDDNTLIVSMNPDTLYSQTQDREQEVVNMRQINFNKLQVNLSLMLKTGQNTLTGTKILHEINSYFVDSSTSNIFQAALAQYYLLDQESAYMFDGGSKYNQILPTYTQANMYLWGEMQWIYDQLITQGFELDSAARLTFFAYHAYRVEAEAVAVGGAANNKFKSPSTLLGWTRDFWDHIYDIFTSGHKNMDKESFIKAYGNYSNDVYVGHVSPMMMFTLIEPERLSDNDKADFANLIADYAKESNKKSTDKISEQKILESSKYLHLKTPILVALYLDLLGQIDIKTHNGVIASVFDEESSHEMNTTKLTGNSVMHYYFTNYNTAQVWSANRLMGKENIKDDRFKENGKIADNLNDLKRIINNYKIATISGEYRADLRRILLATNESDPILYKAFEEFKTTLQNNSIPHNFDNWISDVVVNSVNEDEYKSMLANKSFAMNFAIAKAFTAWASKLAVTYGTATKMKVLTNIDNKSTIYIFPYMITGENCFTIISNINRQLGYSTSNIQGDLSNKKVYMVYSGVDIDSYIKKFGSLNSGAVAATLGKNSEFVRPKDIIKGITFSGYIDEEANPSSDGGFSFHKYAEATKIVNNVIPKGYLNIWKMIYGNLNRDDISILSGEMQVNSDNLLQIYHSLNKSNKLLQDNYAINYDEFFKSNIQTKDEDTNFNLSIIEKKVSTNE